MPPVPVVAIEIPAETPPELTSVVLRSCNLALGAGRCVAAGGAETEYAWIASFRPDLDLPSQLRVDLRNATPRRTHTRLTRTLDFDGSESVGHRWSTAGVVVAALVVSAESTGYPDEEGSERPRTVPSEPAPKPFAVATTSKPKTARAQPPATTPTEGHALRVDLGGLMGNGIEDGSMRFGGKLRPSLQFSAFAFAWSEIAFSYSKLDIKTRDWSGKLGLGFVLSPAAGPFGLEARLGLQGDRMAFEATEGQATDHDSQWRGGALAGIDFILVVSRPLQLWVAGDASLLFPEVDLVVGSRRLGHLGLFEGSIALGARYRLDFDRR